MDSIYLFASSAVGLAFWFRYKRSCRTSLLFRKENELHLQKCSVLTSYRPTPLFFIDWHGHVHTIAPSVIRQIFSLHLPYDREIISLPDGGSVGKS